MWAQMWFLQLCPVPCPLCKRKCPPPHPAGVRAVRPPLESAEPSIASQVEKFLSIFRFGSGNRGFNTYNRARLGFGSGPDQTDAGMQGQGQSSVAQPQAPPPYPRSRTSIVSTSPGAGPTAPATGGNLLSQSPAARVRTSPRRFFPR